MNKDIIIISVTILVGFMVFVGIIYFVSVMLFPRITDNVENYYKRKPRRGTLPGNLGNPYSFPAVTK